MFKILKKIYNKHCSFLNVPQDELEQQYYEKQINDEKLEHLEIIPCSAEKYNKSEIYQKIKLLESNKVKLNFNHPKQQAKELKEKISQI